MSVYTAQHSEVQMELAKFRSNVESAPRFNMQSDAIFGVALASFLFTSKNTMLRVRESYYFASFYSLYVYKKGYG